MENKFIIPVIADLNIVEAIYEKIEKVDTKKISWENTIEDLYEESGKLRIRTKEKISDNTSRTKISSEICLFRESNPSENFIVSMKLDFKPENKETEEKIKEIRRIITDECKYNLYRKVEAKVGNQTCGEKWLYIIFKQLENFKLDYYDNSYYNVRNKGTMFLKDHNYSYKKLVNEEIEFELERESRVYIQPAENLSIDFTNYIIDTYDKSERFRIRNKNGELRYSIKVPLFSRDEECVKSCIRIEFKPQTPVGKEMLEKVLEKLEKEKEKFKREKWGGKYRENGADYWINKNEKGEWWIEFDLKEDEKFSFSMVPEKFKIIKKEKK